MSGVEENIVEVDMDDAGVTVGLDVLHDAIDVPEDEDEDFIESIRSKAVDPDTGKKVFQDKPEVAPKVEEESPTVESSEEDSGEETKANEEGEKEIKKPWARARILEKEKSQQSQKIVGLEHRVEKLTAALETLLNKGLKPDDADAAQPGEEPIDPEVDPAGAMLQEIRSVKKEMESLKAEREAAKQAELIAESLHSVNVVMHQQLNKDPVFGAAVEHVATVVERNLRRQFPDRSDDELKHRAVDAVNRTKLEWVRDNKNPVDEIYGLAMDYGFDPDAAEAKILLAASKGETKPQSATPRDDAKKSIERARERASSTASLGNVEGNKPRTNAMKRLASIKDEDEWSNELKKLVESGEIPKDPTSIADNPPFSVMLAGKGKRIG